MASASTYLSKTFSTGDNRKKWTWSAWIKRSNLGSDNWLFHAWVNSSNENSIFFDSSDRLAFSIFEGGTNNNGRLTTTRKFRDTNAWYHIQCVWDSANATATDRMIIYVNGERETAFDTQTNATLNYDSLINSNNVHYIGQYGSGSSSMRFSGSMTHVNFIDGTAYAASAFGETDATTGIWKPKTAPSVTYGTNGFFLKFENSGSMGTDSSGNANNFTVNGTLTQTVDTPSNVFATINPLANGPGIGSISNGNLTTYNANVYETSLATLGFSTGKWYWELKNVTQVSYTEIVGVANEQCDLSNNLGATADGWSYFIQSNSDNGNSFNNNTRPASPYTTSSQGDIISVAVDADAGKIWFGINGTWVNSGDPAAGTGFIFDNLTTNGFYFPAHTAYDGPSSGNPSLSYNFGNGYFGTTAVSSAQNPDDGIGIFEYDVPTGYRALCTKSINAEEYS